MSLRNRKKKATVQSFIGNITAVKINSTATSNETLEIISNDPGVISRLEAYSTLSSPGSPCALEWSGDSNRAECTCSGASGDLNTNIYQSCGIAGNLHWWPAGNGNAWRHNQSSEDLNLWVK